MSRSFLPNPRSFNLQFAIRNLQFAIFFLLFLLILGPALRAADLTVELKNGEDATMLGAIARFDEDGNLRKLPDAKAKIDAPAWDATAERAESGRWIFKNLPAGKYDLAILLKDRARIEGFQFAPVREFDPFISPDAAPAEDARDFIAEDIKKSPHYENKVAPLYLAGDKKTVRILVQLIRDKPTSYEAASPGAATMRHEIWQYTWNYGGWQKEKRTKVLNRVLLPRGELRKWTWLWDPKLGGIEMKGKPVELKYEIQKPLKDAKLKGLLPY
ncbi:MAG: hypothetical protein IT426_11350 [Pirellulales bacterium]|nr:hypothetical protein [Pirellulales bacterium]